MRPQALLARPADGPLLTSLAAVAERRLGLAAQRWPALALHRRLEEMMADAALPEESPTAFVRRLAVAEEASAIALAAADALPNGETYFFRDAEQLEAVALRAVPRVAPTAAGRALNILCAGCSTGEEVYSLAMLLLDAYQVLEGGRFRVWGLDVSPRALRQAEAGRYTHGELARSETPLAGLRRFFRPCGDAMEVRPQVRAGCTFVRANLLTGDALPVPGTFDVVLCRNVLIHVSRPHYERMLDAVVALARPGGALAFGRAEAGLVARPELTPLSGEGLGLFLKRPLEGA